MSQMHPGNLLGRDSRQLDAWEEEINAALSKLPQHALQSFWNLAVPCLLCDSGVCHRLAYLANTLGGGICLTIPIIRLAPASRNE